jgi:uncharacterized damage-inducible protein DinB
MRRRTALALVFFASLASSERLLHAQANPAATAAAPALASLKAEYLQEAKDVESKIRALAEAIPEDKYGWRPAPGVRSVAEVFQHISGGSYFLTKFAGATSPSDVPQGLEKLTAKKDVLAWLDKSFAHLHASLEAATPEMMAKPVEFFGEQTTGRGIYFKAYGHMSEHLGQAIAYARANGITPPWSK